MAIVINGVIAAEIIEGYGEGAGREGLNSTKRYLTTWADRIAFANGMLGAASVNAGPYGTINFIPPVTHPEHVRMVASSVSIQGQGNPRQGAKQLEFDWAVHTVSYGIMPWNGNDANMVAIAPGGGGSGGDLGNPTSFTYASMRMSFGAEYLVIGRENSKLKFATSGKKIDQDYPIPISILHLSITFHKVPFLPWPLPKSSTSIDVNSLNSTATFGAAPGYLKYDGSDTSRTLQSDGTATQEYTVNFSYRDVAPWDAIFDPAQEIFDRVLKSNGDPIVPRVDFQNLIPRYSVA